MQVKDWIEEWVLLFPKEIKSGGESIQTKAKYCVNKLTKFVRDHPNFTKNTIFAATKLYLAEREQADWFAVKRAIYFIGKLGQESLLEKYCEKVLSGDQKPVKDIIDNYNAMDDYI